MDILVLNSMIVTRVASGVKVEDKKFTQFTYRAASHPNTAAEIESSLSSSRIDVP
jgi:hypothetical protein